MKTSTQSKVWSPKDIQQDGKPKQSRSKRTFTSPTQQGQYDMQTSQIVLKESPGDSDDQALEQKQSGHEGVVIDNPRPEPESFEEDKPTGKKHVSVLERLGPNALDFAKEAPPELVAARLALSEKISSCNKNPDEIPFWVERKVDRWMAAAMWERVRGEDVRNRKLTDGQLETILSDILQDAWQSNGECIKFTPNGQVIDGQGRLAALLLAARRNPNVFIVTDVRFRVPSESFWTLDTGKNRTSADILDMAHISNGYLLGAMARLWNAYHNGTMRSMPKISKSRILQIVKEEEKLFVDASRTAMAAKENIQIAGSILGFACALGMRANENKTRDFFAQIGSGLNLSEGDPSWVLTRIARNKSKQHRKGADRVQMAALTVKALNAHFLGQDIDVLRWGRYEPFPRFVGDRRKGLPGGGQTGDGVDPGVKEDAEIGSAA